VVEFGYRDLRSRWRPLHSQVQLMRLCIFNLLQWRHSFLDMAVQTFLRASGVVPSAELGCPVLRSSAGCDQGFFSRPIFFLGGHRNIRLPRNLENLAYFSDEIIQPNFEFKIFLG
jgi:hypothetical protein